MKKFYAFAAILPLSLMLTACEKDKISASSSILSEAPIISETSAETVTETSVEEPENIIGDSETLFDSFMTGKAKALVTGEGDSGQYYRFSEAMEMGKEYTLDEIIENLRSYMAENGWDKEPERGPVSYEIIDCGVDGRDDYHVTVELPVPGIEDFVVDMILVEKEGKLVVGYDCDSWSRSQVQILPNGEIMSGGSAGASCIVFTEEYVDGNGNYIFGYLGQEENNLGSTTFYIPFVEGTAKVDLSEVDYQNVDISTITFVKGERTVSDIYVSIVSTKEGDEDVSFDETTPIGKIFKEAGVNVLSSEDMEKLMSDTLTEKGFKY